MGNLGTIKTPESFTSMGRIPDMTAYCETPDCFEASLNQHSDTLEGLRHRAYRDRSRDDRVGIMICDKDRLFVEGIAALIEQWDEFDLLAKIYSYDEALAAAKEHLPAVVLLGARVGDAPCAPVIRDILASDPGVCIMVLASSGDSREVLDALRAGAMGYGVRNELSVDRLRGTIWGMVCGEVVFDGSIRTHLQEALRSSGGQEPAFSDADPGLMKLLTQREREILCLLMDGLSNQEVATRLFISEPTVKKNVSRIIDKLQVQNRVQAAVYAARHLPR